MKDLDLSSAFKIIKDHFLIIALTGILLAVMVFGYNSFFVAPTYRTSTTILINNGGLAEVGIPGESVSNTDLNASLYLVETCVDILESDNMYKELAKALGEDYSYFNLQQRFKPTPRGEDSLLIDIATSGTNPEEIKKIANTFLEIAPTFIRNNILSVDVKILATAEKTDRTGPRVLFNTAAAFVFGVGASALFFIVLALLKNTIENESDFKAKYNIPLLGTVPVFENNQTKGKRNEKFK